MHKSCFILSIGLLTASCGGSTPAPWPTRNVTATVSTAQTVAEVSPRFLSVAIDASQAFGGEFWKSGAVTAGGFPATAFDFSHAKLRKLAAPLAPGYLRIGGSHADLVYYDLSDSPVSEPPAPYRRLMNRAIWDGFISFATDLGYEVLFNLNAGPGPRDGENRWTPDNARHLIEFAVARGDPVTVWELGNEPNGFPAIHGLDFTVTGEQYAADVEAARALVHSLAPQAKLAGPACAYWPLSGELNPIFPQFMAAGGGRSLDLITWHYYPQQSFRCPVAVRPAGPKVLLDPDHLDEVAVWAKQIEDLRDQHAPGTPIWLGETGNAQCGGEPGVSDRFVGGLWWLDELGLVAKRGHFVVVRQTLSGSTYGLLDRETLDPKPDYWNSLLWKRLMGPKVLSVDVDDSIYFRSHVRGYAHCTAAQSGHPAGAVTVLLINLDPDKGARVRLNGALGGSALAYPLTSDDLQSERLLLAGKELVATADGTLPALEPVAGSRDLLIAPAGYTFVVFPNASAPACR